MTVAHRKTIYEILGREPVHPFPARMAPGIVLDVLGANDRSLRVLDPMMGSGTVVAAARMHGHRAVGVDIDPLAVLIASVWVKTCDKNKVRRVARDVLDRSRMRFKSILTRDAYPLGADRETKKFITYWFDDYVRRQLTALSESIRRIRDDRVRAVLWCAFSRLIITKQSGVSLAMDLAHSRPHKAYVRAPIKPFNRFLSAVDKVLLNSIDRNDADRGPSPVIKLSDARRLPVDGESIDLVLTSPPYLNAIDYIRCSKFSLVWMGKSVSALRTLRSESVGSEVGLNLDADSRVQSIIKNLKLSPKLNSRGCSILAKYISDMQMAMSEVRRVLVPNGRAVYVVGENTVRGTFIPNAKILTALAQDVGLKLLERRTRVLPQNRRYLPPPAAGKEGVNFDARMRREVLLTFGK